MNKPAPQSATDKHEGRTSSKPTPRDAIVGAAFDAATTAELRERLGREKPCLAVAIRVPTAAWVKPVSSYFLKKFGSAWTSFNRDGSDRQHRADRGGEDVALDLGRGKSVVGVAADPGLLPSTLVACADLSIRIGAADASVVADAIQRFVGRKLRFRIVPEAVVGLDIDELTAAFRPGSSARAIYDRLRRTAATVRGESDEAAVPDLETATEYGKARAWGLALARDIAEYRAGRLTWSAIDRGAVLFSQPGMGKTLFSRMLAKKCGLPLISSSVADWFIAGGGYLNDVIRAERRAFEQAAALAPCILFLDEIDAIPNRTTLSDRNRDYWTPLINDILVNLDNAVAGKRQGVVVVGATNNIANMDAALMRPGRLERAIEIEPPGLPGTLNILRHHVAGAVREADLAEIAAMIERSTGAEIMQYVREARRIARQAGRALQVGDLRAAVLPQADFTPQGLWRVCIHEAGHAIGALDLGTAVPKRCVVRGQGGSEGETLLEPIERDLPTREAIEDRVVVLLCGRAAELAIIGNASAGAGGSESSDLALATRMVAALYLSAGLGESLVYLAPPQEATTLLRNDAELRTKVDARLRELQRRATDLIGSRRKAVLAVAANLKDRRHLSGEHIRTLFDANPAERDLQARLQDSRREPKERSGKP